jgi:tetrahydromethanopterin S-methyltransferase subunit B
MGFVQVLPEFGLVVDPLIGVISTAGESLQPIIERVEQLENITEDLVGMLSGEGNFLASFPNREGVLKIAGGVTAFWYGMVIGLFIAGVIILGMI